MRHHLRNLHFAPLPLRRRLKLVDTRDHLVDSVQLEEIFHEAWPPAMMERPASYHCAGAVEGFALRGKSPLLVPLTKELLRVKLPHNS